jgi:hypothetical protein
MIIIIILLLWLYNPLLGLGRFFSFLILYTVGRTPGMGDQPAARPLPTHRTTQTHNISTQTSMPWVGFEPTIPVFERAKTVHALDRAATVIGPLLFFFFILYLPIYNLLDRNKVISKCGICLCLEGGNYPAVVHIHFKYLSPLASVSRVFVH